MRHSLPYRMLRKRPMKLSTTVILMVSAVLFSVLLVVCVGQQGGSHVDG